MAVGIAAASANSILDALAKGTDYPGNAAVWVKLHIGDPGSAGASNAAGNTTRQQATFASAASGANATNADTGLDERLDRGDVLARLVLDGILCRHVSRLERTHGVEDGRDR
jgi:hypothetical protein